MVMTDQTNPRKLYVTGGNWVLSLPKDWATEQNISPGDRFVLEETDAGFQAVKVEFRRASDV